MPHPRMISKIPPETSKRHIIIWMPLSQTISTIPPKTRKIHIVIWMPHPQTISKIPPKTSKIHIVIWMPHSRTISKIPPKTSKIHIVIWMPHSQTISKIPPKTSKIHIVIWMPHSRTISKIPNRNIENNESYLGFQPQPLLCLQMYIAYKLLKSPLCHEIWLEFKSMICYNIIGWCNQPMITVNRLSDIVNYLVRHTLLCSCKLKHQHFLSSICHQHPP